MIAASSIEAPQLRIANVVKERERAEIQEETRKTYVYLNEKGEMILE